MSPLHQELDRYLTIRRSLGYALGTSARVLRRFVAFTNVQGAEHVTPALFLDWQGSFGAAGRQTWAARLGMVRLFAQWLHGLDPAHVPPPPGLIPHRGRRSRPYIYSKAEIECIVTTTAELPSVYGLRGLVYATLFGPIAATGLRISEALALDIGDVDLDSGKPPTRLRIEELDADLVADFLTHVETERRNGARSRNTEPPRVSRRPFGLGDAAKACTSVCA